jgi:predicted metal-dependent peptidase
MERAAGVILHETDHLLKRHHKRAKALVIQDGEWELWNQATDATINSGLRLEGIPLPDGVCYPDTLDLPEGLSAEEYFRALLDRQKQDTPSDTPDADCAVDSAAADSAAESQGPSAGAGQSAGKDDDDGKETAGHDAAEGSADGNDESGGGGGEPDDDSDGGAGSQDGHSPADNGSSTGAGQAEAPTAEGASQPQQPGTSGSCSDGRQRPWELGPPDDSTPGLDEADQEALIHATAKNVLEKSMGKGSAGHRLWAQDILQPPIDPAAKLLNVIRRYCDVTIGTGERSYRRPGRRSSPDILLPSTVGPLPRITVIIDTSGSMARTDLALALGLIQKVLNAFRIRDGIHVVTGDSTGQTTQHRLTDPRLITLVGGGGTEMDTIIAEVLQQRPSPQLILVCTDCWTHWPEHDPGVPIVACLTRKLADVPAIYKPRKWMVVCELTGGRESALDYR